MIKLVSRCFILIAVAAATARAQAPERPANLRLLASTPTVTISPVEAGRQAVMLPGLSLTISAVSACDEGWQPRKLSLSVADVRRAVSLAKQPESAEITIDVEIPQAQLAPVVIEDFCLASDDVGGQDTLLRLTGYMSAQGALRCARGEEEKVSYTSRAFDVLVKCAAATAPQTAGDL
jgi:hypothetical protein